MLDGVNDRDEDALALVAWAEDLRVKINLIPFNTIKVGNGKTYLSEIYELNLI